MDVECFIIKNTTTEGECAIVFLTGISMIGRCLNVSEGKNNMAFIVGDNCIKCKYTDCVAVCPVDAFFEGPNFLAISPIICIDCGLCEPECPADAIFQEDAVPEDQKEFIELNAELAEIWPNITEVKSAPEDADDWNGVKNKIHLIET